MTFVDTTSSFPSLLVRLDRQINDLERHVRDARFQTADSNGVKLHNKMEAQTAIAAYDIRAVSPEEILQKLAPPEADGSSSRNREWCFPY